MRFYLQELQAKIENRSAVIAVIGLGYVGLPVACTLANAGFRVIGLDVRADHVAMIARGECPIEGDEPGLAKLLSEQIGQGRLTATIETSQLSYADIVTINVETPVDCAHQPDYRALQSATNTLGKYIKPGTLVIVESTVAPGTTDKVVRPLLEQQSGLKVNEHFYLGACPERVMPGRLLANLQAMSRVCGGCTSETAQTMISLYRIIVQADLDATDCVTAELVKTSENAYRDVNIAFANELALVCEATGGDFLQVRELVNKSPGRNVLLAGAGVGGHCIPKDSWLLAYGINGKAPLQLILGARAVNDFMPHHIANLTCEALREAGLDIFKARIAVLGYAYLEDSDDTRNSPSEVLVTRLRALGADVLIHDPWVPGFDGDLLACVKDSDAVVVMVAHSYYKTLNLDTFKQALRTPILIDGRRVFDAQCAAQVGLDYRAVGLGVKQV
jgi:UDP-N-acetyl-D-mannosaminuronic acid dehydrogenase